MAEHDASHGQLGEELERLGTIFSDHARGAGGSPRPSSWDPSATPQTALDLLCAVFGLDAFERDVLLTCAGCELDAPFAARCRAAAVDDTRLRPTLSLLLACLPGPSWRALGPSAPLRYWQLVHASPSAALSEIELSIDEAVLHFLLGEGFWDAMLDGFSEPFTPAPGRVASTQLQAEHIIGVWRHAPPGQLPLVQVLGPERGASFELAATVCAQLDAPGYRLDAASLPGKSAAKPVHDYLRRWQRSVRIQGAITIVDALSHPPAQQVDADSLARWLEGVEGPVLLLTRQRRAPGARAQVTVELDSPAPLEQRAVWTEALSEHLPEFAAPDELLDRLISTFNMSSSRITSVCVSARGQLDAHATRKPEHEAAPEQLLWRSCRIQARPDLDALAHRLDQRCDWSDFRSHPETLAVLHSICAQVRYRATVYGHWRVGSRSGRGQGISVLFSGPSGTGKTMAAGLIGAALDLDVYRIDLSAVVSKYIGETEKNLGRVFDAAEGSGVVLLFDEADALFGKRTEVKDSHDRHANVETGYLLQRMESYSGLAILTTNLRDDLDAAFLRRLRFIVEFRHPSTAERRELWRLALAQGAPSMPLDEHALAQLDLTGGQIRNVVLNAAFGAAAADRPIDGPLLREAITQEYEKHGRLLSNAELDHIEANPGTTADRG